MTAAQSFENSAIKFKLGLDGMLDVIDGCPSLLAEGLADNDDFGDLPAVEWEHRFDNPLRWIRG